MTLTVSPATIAFLSDVNEQWGGAWARTLAREINAGTFTELDGEACIVAMSPAWQPIERAPYVPPAKYLELAREIRQLRLGVA